MYFLTILPLLISPSYALVFLSVLMLKFTALFVQIMGKHIVC